MTDLLETIELESGPPPEPAPRRSLRWLWFVFGGAAVLFFMAVPVRLTLARSEVQRLEEQWQSARAIDSGRVAVAAALAADASPADADRVTAGNHAAKEEAITGLQQLSQATGRDLVVDLQVRRLRQAVAKATALLADQEALGRLGGFDEQARYRTFGEAAQQADQLLAAQLHRFGLRPAPNPPARHLASADPVLISLSHILDQPSKGRLVVTSPAGIALVDLGTNTVTPIRLGGLPHAPVDRIVPRAGWVAVVVAVGKGVEALYAADRSFSGSVRPLALLANVPAVFPGTRPDTVWVELPDGRLEEVDDRGSPVTGPVKLPANGRVVGVVNLGLVVAAGPVVTVWDPHSAKVVLTIGPSALFVSGAGQDTVAWVTAENALRFTTVSTGAVTNADASTSTGGLPGGSIGALSPDGRYFASTFIDLVSGRPIPAVVDVGSGAVREPIGPAGELFDIGGLLWSATSDRLYLNASRGSDGGHDAMVWPIAGGAVSYLRLGGGSVAVLAVLAAA